MRKLNLIHLGLLLIWGCFSAGCTVWPVMTNGHGYRPLAMGKSDQVMWPWASQPTELVKDQGESVRQIMSAQIVNPQASENPLAVNRFDGKAANLAMDRYRKFFAKPPFANKQASSTTAAGS